MTYKYWISGNDVAIFTVEDVPEHCISLQDFWTSHDILIERKGIMDFTITFLKKYGFGWLYRDFLTFPNTFDRLLYLYDFRQFY
jgi:hypothetical protein